MSTAPVNPVNPDNPDHPDNALSFAAPPAPPRPVTIAAIAAPAPGGNPRADSLNLASRPFGNSRPVVRVSLILWLLGLALLLSNVFVFRTYLSDSADKRALIAHGEEELLRQQKDVSDLQARLNGYDLVRLNDQIDFLNTQIDARTFSWSLLIDRIADTLPNDVRLNRLTPLAESKAKRETRGRGAQRDKRPEGEVDLSLSGTTRRDEALNQFVKNLFAHPAFKNPNLLQESQVDTGGPLVKFEATVTYLPGGPPHNAVVEEAPAGTPATPRKKAATADARSTTSRTTAKTTARRAPGGRP
jgi:Tfp pilus assembly protein PilN